MIQSSYRMNKTKIFFKYYKSNLIIKVQQNLNLNQTYFIKQFYKNCTELNIDVANSKYVFETKAKQHVILYVYYILYIIKTFQNVDCDYAFQNHRNFYIMHNYLDNI